jgi:hypothetical protein
MRPEQFTSDALVAVLCEKTIATMDELKRALGTRVDMTVFRKLRTIRYATSYSHRGMYYALESSAEFDERGIWIHRGVSFSKFGSLVDTAERFVSRSERGFLAPELSVTLGVETKDVLLHLVELRRLSREKFEHIYLYCARNRQIRAAQVAARRAADVDTPFGPASHRAVQLSDEVNEAMASFIATLNEKQRRLYAGLESLRLGHGGDQRVAHWTGLDVHTVAKGRKELQERDIDLGRIRRPGGGRTRLEKKRRK